jgi:hypothetical protein
MSQWEHILLDNIAESNGWKTRSKVESTQGILGALDNLNAITKKDLLTYMTILENSPVLCAYGLER